MPGLRARRSFERRAVHGPLHRLEVEVLDLDLQVGRDQPASGRAGAAALAGGARPGGPCRRARLSLAHGLVSRGSARRAAGRPSPARRVPAAARRGSPLRPDCVPCHSPRPGCAARGRSRRGRSSLGALRVDPLRVVHRDEQPDPALRERHVEHSGVALLQVALRAPGALLRAQRRAAPADRRAAHGSDELAGRSAEFSSLVPSRMNRSRWAAR